MPILLADPPAQPAPLIPPRKVWTREECARLSEAQIQDWERLELIGGELIKVSKNRPHINVVAVIQAWLIGVFGLLLVQQEGTIDVAPEDNPTNEPQPDLVVLAKPVTEFKTANPRPQDIRLVVEVADTTLPFDLAVKAGLYARAGITDYWVVDVRKRRVYVHREPKGRYESVTIYEDHEPIQPLEAPTASFVLSDILSV